MKINAIVLHSIKYRETDLIAYLYTLQKGRQSCLLHGARKPAARTKAALLQPLFIVEIEAHSPKKPEGMGIIKELKATPPLANIADSISKTAIALFMSETLYRFIKEEEANSALYSFLEKQIIALNGLEDGIVNFHLYFLTHLAQHLGFLPGNSYDARLRRFFDLRTGCFSADVPAHRQCLHESASLLLWEMLHCSPAGLGKFALNRMQRSALLGGLLNYYSFHLGITNPVRSLGVLGEVFS